MLDPFVKDPAGAVVITDFDGTLAPIVDDPPAAKPLPGIVEILGRLAGEVGRVAVVSGRPVDFLRRHLPVDGLTLVGQYGIERFAGGAVTVVADAARWAGAVARAAAEAEAELPGLYVERKGTVAVGLHWRRQPELEAAATAVGERLARSLRLQLEPGRQTLELRAPVAIDKGTVTGELAAGASAALFIGDDRGDLPAFDALARLVAAGELRHALRVAVRSPETPPDLVAHADMTVEGPIGVLGLLANLADRL